MVCIHTGDTLCIHSMFIFYAVLVLFFLQPPFVSPNVQTSRPETAALQPQYQTETRSTTLAAAAYDNDNDTSAVSIMWSSFSRGRITAVYDLYNNFTGDKQLTYLDRDILFVLSCGLLEITL